jgi:hypothetical protein
MTSNSQYSELRILHFVFKEVQCGIRPNMVLQLCLISSIQVNIIFPIIFFIICLFLVTLPFYVSPWEVGIGLALIISGIPVYIIFIYWKDKPLWLIRTSGKLLIIVAYLV